MIAQIPLSNVGAFGSRVHSPMRNTDCPFSDARIVVVDDEPANVLLLVRLLEQWGYDNFVSTTDSSQVVPLVAAEPAGLVLLDLVMPPPDGFEVMEQLSARSNGHASTPILALTADISTEMKERALSSGASDFLTKPFEATEVRLRVHNLLRARSFQLQLERQNELLDQRMRERTYDLEHARKETLERLALAGEYRDDETHEHAQRVGRTAALLALELGRPRDEVQLIRRSAPLHDIGKLGISDAILLKPGRLTADEFKVMQGHTSIGARILGGSRSAVLQMGELIARTHHECWDGAGYPARLAAEAIPLPARLVALADVFDALTHDRPYKAAWPLEEAVAEIRRGAGSEFDPALMRPFDRLEHSALLAPLEDVDPAGDGQR